MRSSDIRLAVRVESWPIRGSFVIARGAKTEAEVVVAELTDGESVGRGECVPYDRYDETTDSVGRQIDSVRDAVQAGIDRNELQDLLPPGAARNALDCASWDLDAKRSGRRVWDLAGIDRPEPQVTAFTISLGPVDTMHADAVANVHRPLLKLKLGGPGDVDRVRAVRAGAPDAEIIVDANEAWTPGDYAEIVPALVDLGVAMIEQPFPESRDAILADLDRPIPVCADESAHDRGTLGPLSERYELVNIKLDKAGGLTEALALRERVLEAGLGLMVGSMVGTSLGMAPATLLMSGARFVDLDGPLLLGADRVPGLKYHNGVIQPPEPEVWG